MIYYNEIDKIAAQWLRELIKAGHLPDGEVDERDIRDILPSDLCGFTQHHFFAGIGGWPLALHMAGWPVDRPVWTGSCPCQPFSAAGKGAGFDDERHLWPSWFWLIDQCRPPVVFGEQVASKDGLGWFDLVYADLEGAGYAVGAADLCAAGLGAPHIRQRLYFGASRLADADHAGLEGRWQPGCERADQRAAGPHGMAGGVADTYGRDSGAEREQPGWQYGLQPPDSGAGGVAYAERIERRTLGICGLQQVRSEENGGATAELAGSGGDSGGSPLHGFWRDADWLHCRDAKWRPVEPGTFPLAHGVSGRVGLLRGYGNAIVPQVAATFIQAYGEAQ